MRCDASVRSRPPCYYIGSDAHGGLYASGRVLGGQGRGPGGGGRRLCRCRLAWELYCCDVIAVATTGVQGCVFEPGERWLTRRLCARTVWYAWLDIGSTDCLMKAVLSDEIETRLCQGPQVGAPLPCLCLCLSVFARHRHAYQPSRRPP